MTTFIFGEAMLEYHSHGGAGLRYGGDTLNTAIRSQLARDGEAMIAATRVDGSRYLKFTLLNPATTVEQMGEIVDLIVAYGVANHCSRQSIAAAPAANRTYRHHG